MFIPFYINFTNICKFELQKGKNASWFKKDYFTSHLWNKQVTETKIKKSQTPFMVCRYKNGLKIQLFIVTPSLYLIASLEHLVISSSHITADFWWFVAKQHKLSQNKAYFALLSLLLFASGAALLIFRPKKGSST